MASNKKILRATSLRAIPIIICVSMHLPLYGGPNCSKLTKYDLFMTTLRKWMLTFSRLHCHCPPDWRRHSLVCLFHLLITLCLAWSHGVRILRFLSIFCWEHVDFEKQPCHSCSLRKTWLKLNQLLEQHIILWSGQVITKMAEYWRTPTLGVEFQDGFLNNSAT